MVVVAASGTQRSEATNTGTGSVRMSRSGVLQAGVAAGDTKRPAKGSGSGAGRRPARRRQAAKPGRTTPTLPVPAHAASAHHQAQARAKHLSPWNYSSSSAASTLTSTSASTSPSASTSSHALYRSSPGNCNSRNLRLIAAGAAPPAPSLPSLVAAGPSPGIARNAEAGDVGHGHGHCHYPREARRPIMQRVSAFLPSWDKRASTRSGLFGWSSNRSSASGPAALAKINTTSANGRIHREAFWPVTLDGECEKAARILKSFATDGYLAPADDQEPAPDAEPTTPVLVTKKIPRRIIQNAAGIAVFTCMRSGLWMTGSGGSGILIARKSDGTWSPPSGIMLHTPTLSFIIGVDIYDCVLVVNNLAALESITKPHVTLGEDVGLTGGPLVSLESDETDISCKDLGNTVLTYMKARGRSQDVNLNGCILAERGNENERFYSSGVTQMDILAGNVARHVEETMALSEVIKLAEGRSDFDASVIAKIAIEPAPGDAVIATPKSSTPASPGTAFGIPNVEDPDPFGVLALEMAGLEIREAGSRLRPASSQFEFNPNPMSPAYTKFNRQSVDTYMSKSNRGSYMSSRTVKSQMTDAGTQTDVGNTPETTPSPSQSEDGRDRARSSQIPEVTEEEEEVDYTKVDLTPLRHISGTHSITSVTALGETAVVEQDKLKVDDGSRDDLDKRSKASSIYEQEEEEETREVDDDDALDEDEEEPVVFEVAAVQPARTRAVASRMIHAKGNMVTIPKRVPPPLPMRSAARISRSSKSDLGDVSSLHSPLRQSHSNEELSEDETRRSVCQSQSEDDRHSVETKAVDEKSDESETEFFPAEELKAEEPKQQDGVTVDDENNKMERKTETQVNGVDDKDDDKALNIPQPEQVDGTDAIAKKHTSSIYTGATSERWSLDGSSLTTPTSDRPFSVADDMAEEKTPKKQPLEVERSAPMEQHNSEEKPEAREAAPSTIAVA